MLSEWLRKSDDMRPKHSYNKKNVLIVQVNQRFNMLTNLNNKQNKQKLQTN